MTLHDTPREEVLIFTRYPRAGKVKTRLMEKLGRGEAARIHKFLAEHALKTGRQVTRMRTAGLTVWYTGSTDQEMRDWLGNDIPLAKQQGNDLGRKMAAAFHNTWAQGAHAAVLIGSDCPSLDAALIGEALDRLEKNDVVLGPAADGGYYLIGLHRRIEMHKAASLFENITWGTNSTLRQTIAQAAKAGLSIATLKELHDIDRPEDLAYLGDYSDPQ